MTNHNEEESNKTPMQPSCNPDSETDSTHIMPSLEENTEVPSEKHDVIALPPYHSISSSELQPFSLNEEVEQLPQFQAGSNDSSMAEKETASQLQNKTAAQEPLEPEMQVASDQNIEPEMTMESDWSMEPDMSVEPEDSAKHTTAEEEQKEKSQCYKETILSKTKKDYSFKKIIAACLVVSIAGGGSIGASYAFTQNHFASQATANASAAPSLPTDSKYIKTGATAVFGGSDGRGEAINIVKKVYPSVVSIITKATASKSYFSGFSIPYESTGAGSGVIFHEDDEKVYIATNDHVVQSATNITISIDGTEKIPATIVGTDTTADLAVISILKSDLQNAGVKSVQVATFGDSNTLEVGETVIAIGNALGEGKSATGGMISAADKTIVIDGRKISVIQTDAAINPGNSGGALVNYKGEIVGINTAKAFDNAVEGMGYAIPSNVVTPIIEKLLTDGSIEKPYLGIIGQDVTNDLAQIYGLPVGVMVTQVLDGGSAQISGMQEGDIIIDFGGTKIMNMDALTTAIANHQVGETIAVKLIRNGTTPVTVSVTMQDANKANE